MNHGGGGGVVFMHVEVIIKQKRKKSNGEEEIKVSVFRFPKNPVEREREVDENSSKRRF